MINWAYVPVYGMVGRGRHLADRRRSDVVAHRLDDGRNCGGEHPHERRGADCRRPPLSCSDGRNFSLYHSKKNDHLDFSTTSISFCIISSKHSKNPVLLRL